MKKIDFNKDWTYRRTDETITGKPVTIPHDAMLSEMRTSDSLGGINTGWFEGYDYIYEKRFYISVEDKDKNIRFEFEGVYHNAEIYVNGKQAAYRPYGYTNFYVDVSHYLRYGEENLIQVIARNADQPNSRWYSGAGIYRPVWMYVAEKNHIFQNGIKVRTISVDPAVIEVEIQTNTAGELQLEVSEIHNGHPKEANVINVLSGIRTEGKKTLELKIPNANLWEVDTPSLYRLKVRFGEDDEEVQFGIRLINWSRKNGFTINGKRVILRGGCIHHDNGVLGACCYPEAEERKIKILKENGFNAVRSAHNPCSKALLDACDRLGMLVMDEFVDVWYIHKTENDYVKYFEDWWQQDLKDMVEKDYNHPSVIMYSIGNEVSETAEKRGIELTNKMTHYLHQLDALRPVTCGINIFFNFLSSVGFGVYSDKKAKKEVVNAENRTGTKKKSVGSQFFNDLAGILGSKTMKAGATFWGCDLKTKEAFAGMDIAGYNYGINRYLQDLKKYPERLILGSETFCSDAYTFWEMAKKHPGIIGDFVWAGMDYLGEVGVGAWEYKEYAPDFSHGPGWITAGSGRIDLTGKPLAEAGYMKTAFELTKRPVIAVRPVNHRKDKHSPSAWKMTNAIESWSWNGYEGEKAQVEVYARASRIHLFINGKQVGNRALKNKCDTVFSVNYQPGILEAVALDESGNELSRNALYSADEETCLNVIPEEKMVRPEGLSFVRIKYTDGRGILKPLERNVIQISVTNGVLLGLGNACPYHETGYLTDKTDTYYGEALAVLKAKKHGTVKISVTDGKLRGEASIPVQESEL
jgi:beta-galactosidase